MNSTLYQRLPLVFASLLAIIGLDVSFINEAMAQAGQTIFTDATTAATTVLRNLRTIFYIVAAIAIIVSALMALGGRWNWGRFFAVFGAIFVVAVSLEIIEFLGGERPAAQ